MRISYNNLLLKPGTTIIGTNENTSFPVSNLLSNLLELPFKATGNSSTITITFDVDYDIDHIAFGFHNLDTLTVNYRDNLDSLIQSDSITIDNNRPIDFVYGIVQSVRKIEFVMTTTDTILYLGGFSTGEYFQFPDHESTPETPTAIRGTNSLNASGQLTGTSQRNSQTYVFNHRFVTQEKFLEFRNVINDLSTNIAHFVDIYEDTRTPVILKPFWGVIVSNSDSARKESESTFEVLFSVTYQEVF
jgi:hypothetical protein